RICVPEGDVPSDGGQGLTRGSLMSTVRLILALHNHQPVGNFDGVFEASYRDSYAPFLEVLEIYPGCEILRYTVPFQEPHATYELLRRLAERRPGATVVFADDGEKFGSWPETFDH